MGKLEEIKGRFYNRLWDSEKYSEFLNNHEPDVAVLLSKLEEIEKVFMDIIERGPYQPECEDIVKAALQQLRS